MGAWGVQFTENDGALDFLGDVADSGNWDDVVHRLTDYVDDGGYDDADEAFVAAELVAAALGKPSPLLDPEIAAWAAQYSDQAGSLKPVAMKAAELIGSASELNELWSEAGDYSDWQATVDNLIARLG